MKYTGKKPYGINQTGTGSIAVSVENVDVASFTSGSLDVSGSLIATTFTASTALINGDVRIKGTASVDVLITSYESSSIIYSSGSTKFGDTLDDTHQFTGSVYITSSLDVTGGITGSLFGTASYVPNLNEVTTAGNTTANAITVGNINANGQISTRGATLPSFAGNGSIVVGSTNLNASIGALLGVQIPYVTGAFGGHFIGYSNQANPKWLIGISRNVAQENSLVYYEDSLAASPRFVLHPGGNVTVNTIIDSGFKLDVNGTGRFSGNVQITGSATNSLLVKGSGTTSSTTAFRVENSNGDASLEILDNGVLKNYNDGSPYPVLETYRDSSGSGIKFTRQTDGYTGRIYWNSSFSFPDNGGRVTMGSNSSGFTHASGGVGLRSNLPVLTLINNTNSGKGFYITAPTSTNSFELWLHDNYNQQNQRRVMSFSNSNDLRIYKSGSSEHILLVSQSGAVEITGSLTVSGSSTFTNIGPAVLSGSITQTASTASFGGLVGIGTTNPTTKLDVRGNVSISGSFSGASGYPIEATNTEAGNPQFLNFKAPGNGSNDGMTIGQSTAVTGRPFVIQTTQANGWGNLTLQRYGGSVGIGTISPSAKLHVKGSGTTNSTTAFLVENANASGSLVVRDSGNIGIGTTNPSAKLDVEGTSEFNGQVSIVSSALDMTDSYYLRWGGTVRIFGSSTSNILVFETAATERMRIAGGNVGIGTTTPAYKLELSGSTAAERTIGVDGDPVVYYPDQASSAYEYSIALGNGLRNATNTGGNAGTRNTAIGISNQTNVTTGNGNVSVGSSTLEYNTTGGNNTTMGHLAGQNIRQSFNTALGFGAMRHVATGSNNVALGYYAGYEDGSSNTITQTINSLYLGTLSKASSTTGNTNEIVIGYEAQGLGSNTVVLGNDSITTTALKGNVGIGTTSPTYALEVSGSGGNQGVIRSRRLIAYGGTAVDPPIATTSTIAGLFEAGYGQLGFSSYAGEAGRIETNARLWNIGMTGGTAKMNIRGTGATSATTALRVENSSTSPSLVVLDNGRVGIGTTNPGRTLHVLVADNDEVARFTSTQGNDAYIQFQSNTSVTLPRFGIVNNDFIFIPSGSETIRFAHNGNVGIGTTTPAYVLDVSGSGNFTDGLTVTGSTSIIGETSIYKSGSTVFQVQGSQGELFAITDSLSGSLFSVSNISGLPIMEVFSDNTTLMGDYLAPALITTKRLTANSGSTVIYSIPTASYDGAFFEYTIKSGSNARAGQIFSTYLDTTASYTDNSTSDIGDTTGFIFGVILSGSNMVLTGSASTDAWTVKTIIRSI